MEITFSRRLAIGFASLGFLTAVVALIGIFAISHVVKTKDRVLDDNARTVQLTQELQILTYRRSAAVRGFLMTGEQGFLEQLEHTDTSSSDLERQLAQRATTQRGKQLAAEADRVDNDWQASVNYMIAMRKSDASLQAINEYMSSSALPKRRDLEHVVDDLSKVEREAAEAAKVQATHEATRYRNVFLWIALLVLLIAAALPWWLNRQLTGQIASAVYEIQSSSTELQTTATQQATGAREQASAMSEITTTMTELLTTSRQIAHSAQQVSGFSTETATAALSGDRMVRQARGSVGTIRDQVDTIVNHMLELGRRSQQIGGVTELINELAEQTNILSINANIEAVGAGEAGRRFGVVAEEIRNLADRMSGAAREIRGLVEEVRSAVNTTVMATEAGSKAVDAGAKDFDAVSESLEQILALVQTATDAAREIELSTKQQSTAVEQVNVAVSAVAQVSREVESSTVQASQTASELARLSGRMAALVQQPRDDS